MTSDTKKLILYALEKVRRAKSSFSRLSKEQMQQKYGQSDQTCQEILDGYLKHEAEVMAAIEEIKSTHFVELRSS